MIKFFLVRLERFMEKYMPGTGQVRLGTNQYNLGTFKAGNMATHVGTYQVEL